MFYFKIVIIGLTSSIVSTSQRFTLGVRYALMFSGTKVNQGVFFMRVLCVSLDYRRTTTVAH